MGDRKQINIVVDESQKEDWEDYVDESDECSSLSHLIRLAVSREISETTATPSEQEVSVDLGNVEERLGTVETQLDEISNDVKRIIEEEETESLEELAAKVYDEIPTISDVEEWKAHLDEENRIEEKESNWDGKEDWEGEATKEYALYSGYQTLQAIEEKVEESEYRVRKALEQVKDSFSRVKEYQYDGQTYVYEVEYNGE